jgi:NADPH-dependent ferric siderophore reductase
LEVNSLAESNEVKHHLGLSQAALISKVPGDAHLADVEKELAAAMQAAVDPWWNFTGNAQSIQTIRKSLRNRRIASSSLSIKAYWAYGKKGLD